MNPAINVHRGADALHQIRVRQSAREASSVKELGDYKVYIEGAEPTAAPARWVYIFSLAGFIVPFTGLIGLIMAYMNRDGAPAWLASHYQFQIRTFWIGLLFAAVSILLTAFGIGFLLLFAAAAWFLVRYIKGLSLLNRRQDYPNPTTWLF
jgi:uncharacterized membrane protein